MLLVVVGQATEVLGQTCTRASFRFGLWDGVSIDDRQVCVFSSKFAYMGTGVQPFFHLFDFFKRDLRWQGLKSGQKRLLWCGYALYTLGLIHLAQE